MNDSPVARAIPLQHPVEHLVTSQGFAAFYHGHVATVFGYASLKVPEPDVDDVVADVFARAWRMIRKGSGPREDGRAWLVGIARNVIADYHRARPTGTGSIPQLAGHTPGPEGRTLIEAELDELELALAALPERYQQLIDLKFGAGLTNRQIAAITGLSETNVGTILHRALRRLRKELEP